MKKQAFKHRGYSVEIPEQEDRKRMRVKIDGQIHLFGRDASGAFFLHEDAYDRSRDLVELVRGYLDKQERG